MYKVAHKTVEHYVVYIDRAIGQFWKGLASIIAVQLQLQVVNGRVKHYIQVFNLTIFTAVIKANHF